MAFLLQKYGSPIAIFAQEGRARNLVFAPWHPDTESHFCYRAQPGRSVSRRFRAASRAGSAPPVRCLIPVARCFTCPVRRDHASLSPWGRVPPRVRRLTRGRSARRDCGMRGWVGFPFRPFL